jgi:hypothetical protein
MMRRRLLFGFLALITVFTLTASAQSTNDQERTTRVQMKVRSSLAQNIESALPPTNMLLLPGESGSAQVEAFLGRHAARTITPLYPEIVRTKKSKVFQIPDCRRSSAAICQTREPPQGAIPTARDFADVRARDPQQ